MIQGADEKEPHIAIGAPSWRCTPNLDNSICCVLAVCLLPAAMRVLDAPPGACCGSYRPAAAQCPCCLHPALSGPGSRCLLALVLGPHLDLGLCWLRGGSSCLAALALWLRCRGLSIGGRVPALSGGGRGGLSGLAAGAVQETQEAGGGVLSGCCWGWWRDGSGCPEQLTVYCSWRRLPPLHSGAGCCLQCVAGCNAHQKALPGAFIAW